MSFLTYLYQHKLLFFTVCAFLLYGNTLKNTYALDDNFVTTVHSHTSKGLSAFKEIFTTHYIVEEGGENTFEYRPLVKLSFAIEHEIFGMNTTVSHAINIFLYGLCLFVLYKICCGLFYSYPQLFSELIVVFFAFIPLHCEVVASLKNRDILLSFIFAGWCFLMLLKFCDQKQPLYLILAWIFFSTSLLSKLDSLTCIAIFPIILFQQKRAHIKYSLLIFFTMVVGYYTFDTLMNLMVDQSHTKRPIQFYENPLFTSQSLLLRISTAINSFGFYLKMLFVPTHMAAYYGYDTIPVFRFATFYNLLAFLGLAGAVVLTYRYRKNPQSPMFTGLIIFFVSLSMYLNFVKPVPGIVADRFAFIPSVGFSIIIIFLMVNYLNHSVIPRAIKELTIKFRYVLIIVLTVNFVFVYSRNSDWKNSLHLYVHDIEAQPRSLKLHNLCGNEIISDVIRPNGIIVQSDKQKYIRKAESSLKTVLSLDSTNIKALNNLSFIYLNFYRDYEKAKIYISRAFLLDSTKHEIVYNLALANYNLNHAGEAKQYLNRAFILKPEDDHTLELMSELYSNEKIAGEGINLIQQELKNKPGSFKLNLLLGNLFIAKRDTSNALKFLTKASSIKPNDPQLLKMIDILSK